MSNSIERKLRVQHQTLSSDDEQQCKQFKALSQSPAYLYKTKTHSLFEQQIKKINKAIKNAKSANQEILKNNSNVKKENFGGV